MKFRNTIIATVGSALLFASSLTMGVAQQVVDTDRQNSRVEITRSDLENTLTVSITEGNFGSRAYSLSDVTYTNAGSLTVGVDDLRGTAAGWNVTLSAIDFSNGTNTFSIGNLALRPGTPILRTGVTQPGANTTGQSTSGIAAVSGTGQGLWSATRTNGAGRFDLPVQADLLVPGGTLVGTYTSEVTVSISSAP